MEFTFISGATGGIGKAFTKEYATLNRPLFLTGRSQQKLDELANQLSNDYGVTVKTFACDLTDENSRLSMLDYIERENLTFNNIVNVAGVDIQKPVMEYTYEKLLKQIRVNVESTISLTYSLLKRRGKRVNVITISSMSGVTPMPYFALYSATKACLTNFFTSLHYELKKEGVNVTTVLPGGVYTRPDIVQEIIDQGVWGKLSAKTPEFVAKRSIRAVNKNKIKYIPGFFNKFLNFIMTIAPKKIVLSFIAKKWKKISKDAF